MHQPTAMRCINGGSKIIPAAPQETTTGPQAQNFPRQVFITPADPSLLANHPPTQTTSNEAPKAGSVECRQTSEAEAEANAAEVPSTRTIASSIRVSTRVGIQSESLSGSTSTSVSTDNAESACLGSGKKKSGNKYSLQGQSRASNLAKTRVLHGARAVTFAPQRTALQNTTKSPITGADPIENPLCFVNA